MSDNLTIEQQRSGEAYFMVKKVIELEHTNPEKYKSRAKNLPSMVRTNGLLQSLSFLLSKASDDSGCELIAEHVRQWIENAIKKQWLPEPTGNHHVKTLQSTIHWLTQVDVEQYMLVTSEVLNFSPWLKRFASGMIQKEKKEVGNADNNAAGNEQLP
jgi:CRISPR-associated protein Cmr5